MSFEGGLFRFSWKHEYFYPMETVIESYLCAEKDNIKLGSLRNHYRRKKMIDHFNGAIDKLLEKEIYDCVHPASEAVQHLLKIHRQSKCTKPKHYLIYVALKIAFDWRLDAALVTEILSDIFKCEGNFDKVLCGAVTGANSTVTGWRVDQQGMVENLKAVEFFIQACTKQRCLYNKKNGHLRIQEVPIESFGNDKTPLMVALEFDAIPFFILLLRYGAKLYLNKDLFEFKSEKNKMEIEMYLVRCGWTPTRSTVPSSLKFCSKLTIRRALFNAWNLPNGIPKLYLPKELERYLNLEID